MKYILNMSEAKDEADYVLLARACQYWDKRGGGLRDTIMRFGSDPSSKWVYVRRNTKSITARFEDVQ